MKRFAITAGLLLSSLFLVFSVPSFTPKAQARVKTNVALDFVDVNYGEWHTLSDDYMYLNGYMNGKNDRIFAPSSPISRAEIAKILYNMAGSPKIIYSGKYRDLPQGQWYTDACLWAAQNGILTGTSKTTMNPTGLANREQAATILYRYAKKIGINVSESTIIAGFPDAYQVSQFAITPMKWCVAAKIIRGAERGGSFYLKPKDNIVRAEIAAMMCRLRLHVVNNPKNSPNGIHYHNTAGAYLDMPHILQTDPRWYDKKYGNANILTNGCGPTAMSMVESYLKKTFISPDVIVYRIGNKYGTNGTTPDFCENYPETYGFHSVGIDANAINIANNVNRGRPVICLMSKNSCFGYRNGHYVVIRSVTTDGRFLILDPVSEERCEIYYTQDMINRSVRQAWAFY